MNETKPTERIVDGLYRYVLEYDGWGVQQDFPVKQDLEKIEKMFLIEIENQKEERKKEDARRIKEVGGES